MHRLSPSFVLGYHGCTREVGSALLNGELFKKSENDYDWLGPGAYFWEANPQRAVEWARTVRGDDNAFAVGVVIDPGLCLDLTTQSGIEAVGEAYERLSEASELADSPLPQNRGGGDRPIRKLDCAVIRMLHEMNKASGRPQIETVKGVFVEGEELYPGAGFRARTHIQYAVCNLECIKGVFRIPGL